MLLVRKNALLEGSENTREGDGKMCYVYSRLATFHACFLSLSEREKFSFESGGGFFIS